MLPKLVGESTRRDNPAIVDTLRAMILGNSTDAIAGAITAMMTGRMRRRFCPRFTADAGPGRRRRHDDAAGDEREHQQAVSDTELVVISKAGHMSNLEQPDAFNGALARFLSGGFEDACVPSRP